jgi:hypothetical protein
MSDPAPTLDPLRRAAFLASLSLAEKGHIDASDIESHANSFLRFLRGETAAEPGSNPVLEGGKRHTKDA